MRARKEQSVTSNGHGLAMGIASSKMSPASYLSYTLGGIQGIKGIKALDDALSEDSTLDSDKKAYLVGDLAAHLSQIHQLVLKGARQFLVVSESEVADEVAKYIDASHDDFSAAQLKGFELPNVRENVKEAWLTSTQVNFCAKAYPTVPVEHPDSAALTVLGGFLRNGILHRTIREQGGAYGGGANQDNNIAAFRLFSYRDPRLLETFNDFDQSLQWLETEEHDAQALEEAVLGIISSLDKPSSPAGEAKQTFHAELFNRTREKREEFRKRILAVSIEDLQRVARTYLVEENASYGVVTHAANRDAVEQLGLNIHTL